MPIVHQFTGPWHPVWTTNHVCNECNRLHGPGSKVLLVASDKYFDGLSRHIRSWPINVVKTFAWLKAHETHRPDTIFDDSDVDDLTFERGLPEETTTILSLATWNTHYVVIQIKKDHNVVVVYDGFSERTKDLSQWEPHIDRIMARYGLSRINDQPHWIIRRNNHQDFGHDTNLNTVKETARGPVACRILWDKMTQGEIYRRQMQRNEEIYRRQTERNERNVRRRFSSDPKDLAILFMEEMKRMIVSHRERSV